MFQLAWVANRRHRTCRCLLISHRVRDEMQQLGCDQTNESNQTERKRHSLKGVGVSRAGGKGPGFWSPKRRVMQHRVWFCVWILTVYAHRCALSSTRSQTHTRESLMQSKLLCTTSSVCAFQHEQVLKENWPASTCSAVVKPNTAVIEAKCLVGVLWLVPCSHLARCRFWESFHPSFCQTHSSTITTATGDRRIKTSAAVCCLPSTLYMTHGCQQLNHLSALFPLVLLSLNYPHLCHPSLCILTAAATTRHLLVMRWRAPEAIGKLIKT